MKTLQLTHQQNIARLTLNRPDCHNALDEVMIAELRQALENLRADKSLRLLQLTGQGTSFCAGADLRWMQRMVNYTEAENYKDSVALANLMQELADFPTPTLAIVNGAAIGGGAGLVACCDMAIASDHAFCQFSEVKIGLIPAVISPYVSASIGARATRYYFLTAEKITAATALQLGLFSRVVPADALASTVEQITTTLTRNSPAALMACKQLLANINLQIPSATLNEYTAGEIAKIRVSPEGQEGLQAYLQKRHPNWIEDDVSKNTDR
jgi:methylglutaconyl-CoA hydratase